MHTMPYNRRRRTDGLTRTIAMSKIMFSAIMFSAIALAACTPQEHQTLAAYRHAETRIALPADTNCYNDAFNAWTVADANQGALLRLRLDEIYSNPNLPPASPAANRAADDVFALHERLMQYHTDILIQRTGWSRAQVDFCRGIWNHVSQSYDCIGIENTARHNLELGIPPSAWHVGVFHYCANTDPDFLEREFKTK